MGDILCQAKGDACSCLTFQTMDQAISYSSLALSSLPCQDCAVQNKGSCDSADLPVVKCLLHASTLEVNNAPVQHLQQHKDRTTTEAPQYNSVLNMTRMTRAKAAEVAETLHIDHDAVLDLPSTPIKLAAEQRTPLGSLAANSSGSGSGGVEIDDDVLRKSIACGRKVANTDQPRDSLPARQTRSRLTKSTSTVDQPETLPSSTPGQIEDATRSASPPPSALPKTINTLRKDTPTKRSTSNKENLEPLLVATEVLSLTPHPTSMRASSSYDALEAAVVEGAASPAADVMRRLSIAPVVDGEGGVELGGDGDSGKEVAQPSLVPEMEVEVEDAPSSVDREATSERSLSPTLPSTEQLELALPCVKIEDEVEVPTTPTLLSIVQLQSPPKVEPEAHAEAVLPDLALLASASSSDAVTTAVATSPAAKITPAKNNITHELVPQPADATKPKSKQSPAFLKPGPIIRATKASQARISLALTEKSKQDVTAPPALGRPRPSTLLGRSSSVRQSTSTASTTQPREKRLKTETVIPHSKPRPVSLSFPTPPPAAKSRKAPTTSTFVLPGEAVAARLKAAREARVGAPEAEEKKKADGEGREKVERVAFKARPVPKGLFDGKKADSSSEAGGLKRASSLRTSTAATSRPRPVHSRSSIALPAVSELKVGKQRPSTLANTSAPRRSMSSSTTKAPTRTTQAVPNPSSASGPAATSTSNPRSSLAPTSRVPSKGTAKGREVFSRAAEAQAAEAKAKAEKEALAKEARRVASERGRAASREWAEKKKAQGTKPKTGEKPEIETVEVI